MRRPINWFVFCLSLAFLFANVTFGRKSIPAAGQVAAPLVAQSGFSKVMAEENAEPQFGYVHDDGSFVPLPQQPAREQDAEETVWSHWSEVPSVASKAPARF